ncbi:MAG: AAA family ATPase [Solirubrobacterales bacterium]
MSRTVVTENETQQWAAEYVAAIAGDPVRQGNDNDLDAYRSVRFQPRDTTYVAGLANAPQAMETRELRILDDEWPTGFSAAELNWLEGLRVDGPVAPNEYLAHKVPAVEAAFELWIHPPTWQSRFREMAETGNGRISYAAFKVMPLPFQTPEQLINASSESFDVMLEHIAYRGLKSLVVGQSKAGKSFTTWALCSQAVKNGRRVLYLTEEPRQTVAAKLHRFGLDTAGNSFRVLLRTSDGLDDQSWAQVAEKLALAVTMGRVDVVVVDTARPWFAIDGDGSNTADIIGPAMDALSAASAAGAAVVVLHQAPWTGKRARGSTEFHAAADLIFHVDGEGHGPRTIHYVGGRVEDVPQVQTIRLDAGGNVEDLGKMQHRTAERMGDLLRILEQASGPMTVAELADETDYSQRSIREHLVRLESRARVVRREGVITSAGREPTRWRRLTSQARLYGLGLAEDEEPDSAH